MNGQTEFSEHDLDPRTCPTCHCTRMVDYKGNRADGAPIDPVYICVTPFCDHFEVEATS